MALQKAIYRLEKELFPELENSGMGRGILEGALSVNEKPISRGLAVEMVALHIAIKEEQPRYFHYKIANWLPRAIWQMNWNDSLNWWARVDINGFESEYRDKHPMPEDLKSALTAARTLIKT